MNPPHTLHCFRRMLSAVLAIFVATLILFIPLFLMFAATGTGQPATNVTTTMLSNRPHYPFHPDVPKHIIAVVTGVLMPSAFIVVTVSSVLVVVKLGTARMRRKQMSNSQSERTAAQSEASITRMLMCVCFLFIILTLPETTGTLANYAFPEFGHRECYHNTFNVFFRIVTVASCLNSSVNFIAYVSLSAKFKTTLRQIMRWPAHRHNEMDNSKSEISAASVTRLTRI